MGSLTRKITKRANRFQNYLSIIEKHMKEAQEKSGELPLTKPFDLAKTVETELEHSAEDKRKLRNKRKAQRRALKKK